MDSALSVDAASLTQAPAADIMTSSSRLSEAKAGHSGVITAVSVDPAAARGGVDCAELERRLLEAGFVEGARVTLLHEGPLGGDPIAVRLDDMRVALRRREAHGVMIRLDSSVPARR
jgi:ferrous iron transport protein A